MIEKPVLHAGAAAGSGVTAANAGDWEADRLLTLVYYHVIPGQPSMAALTAAGSAETFLDELTSGGEMLRFSANSSQVRTNSCDAAFLWCALPELCYFLALGTDRGLANVPCRELAAL